MGRQRITSGTSWEKLAGYARAVRVGRHVFVSGTTATDDSGNVVDTGDAGAQLEFIIAKIERALREAGASLNDVVRTRIYIVNMADWEAVSRVHGKYFAEIRPANTLVQVSGLVGEGYLVEMEAEALVGDND